MTPKTNLSYELNQRSNRLARYLASLAVAPEVRVAILMESSIEMIVALLGVLKAGGAYVPLDPHYPHERLRWMLSDSGSSLVLTEQWLADNLPSLNAKLVCLDTDLIYRTAERFNTSISLCTGESGIRDLYLRVDRPAQSRDIASVARQFT